MDYDKTCMSDTYDRGRELAPEVHQQWMSVISAHSGQTTVRRVLDLGCGTGRFSSSLADRFTSSVIGVDPSRKMLEQARRGRNHSGVSYVCASGEAIPLCASSIDLIFISMAFHHFTSPQLVAQECVRVLGERGRVFLRTGCRESISSYPYVPYFPSSRVLLEKRLPTLEFQKGIFQEAALKPVFAGALTQQIAGSYSEYADKLSMKADSILICLNEDEFEAGVRAVRGETAAGPIVEPIDFVVFEK